MEQLEISVSDQKIQALRDRIQGEDDSLLREITNRRRPGRRAKVSPSLVPLLRGEAVPALLASDETNTPPGPEGPGPTLRLVFGLATGMLLLTTLSLAAWVMLR